MCMFIKPELRVREGCVAIVTSAAGYRSDDKIPKKKKKKKIRDRALRTYACTYTIASNLCNEIGLC